MEGAAEGSGNEDRICGLSLVAAIQSISLRELTKLYGPGVFFPLCMLYSKYFKVKCIVPKEKKKSQMLWLRRCKIASMASIKTETCKHKGIPFV